jgi:hypothetical protein
MLFLSPFPLQNPNCGAWPKPLLFQISLSLSLAMIFWFPNNKDFDIVVHKSWRASCKKAWKWTWPSYFHEAQPFHFRKLAERKKFHKGLCLCLWLVGWWSSTNPQFQAEVKFVESSSFRWWGARKSLQEISLKFLHVNSYAPAMLLLVVKLIDFSTRAVQEKV